jgi:glyoxylase-like metal-dependent hydrolase (beta-lactamase superfamily II)
MIFRQLFDRESCTYTYLLGDEASGESVLIDPVIEHVTRDMQLVAELGLSLKYTLETHVHADHVTGSGTLRRCLGSRSVMCVTGGADCADILVNDGDQLAFGGEHIRVVTTPGHTNTCVSYHLPDHKMLFTGDTLFVRGCGRTDFQSGDSRTLYRSVHEKVFTLSDDTCIYPGHDYKGRTCTTVAEERDHNPRLGADRSEDEFVEIMSNLKLSPPAKLHIALPANRNCGLPPAEPRIKEPACHPASDDASFKIF